MHLKYGKLTFGVRKLRGNDMDKFQPYGDQITYFITQMESFNSTNFACNHLKQVPHMKHDQQFMNHSWMKEKHK